MSVCSDRLTQMRGLPINLASYSTDDVFPTPGGPSNNIGFPIYIPHTILSILTFVASKQNNDSLSFGFLNTSYGPILTFLSSIFTEISFYFDFT